MKIKFTDEQLLYARELAYKRHEAKHPSFKNKRRLGDFEKKTKVDQFVKHPTHKAHFLGILGEMAYASLVNGSIDENIYKIRDTGFDVDDVEVKASTRLSDDIELKVEKKHYETKFPKKYVLVRIDENAFRTVEVIGEIEREDFNKCKKVKQYRPNYPINYIVGIKHLKLL
jgi:hypothetical protein